MTAKKTISNTKPTLSSRILNIVKEEKFLTGIVSLAVGLRLWLITWGLPEFYEEGIPLRLAIKLLDSKVIGIPDHFFTYPALTTYLQCFVQSIHFFVGWIVGAYPSFALFIQSYTNDPSSFIILARLTTAAFDVGTIIFIYNIAKHLRQKEAGILGAFLVAINILHIKQSEMINVDTPLTLFIVFGVYCILRVLESPEKKWYVLSGISIGLAGSTKYNGAILSLTLVGAHLLRSRSLHEAIKSLKDSRLWFSGGIAIAVFAICNPYIFLHYKKFATQFGNVQEHMAMGHLGLEQNTSTFAYYFIDSLPHILGWPLLIAALLSSGYFFFSKDRKYFALLLFPLTFFIVLVSWKMRADRYVFPVIPFLILIGSVGIVRAWRLIEQRMNNLANAAFTRTVIICIGIFTLAIPSALATLREKHSRSLPDTRTVVKEWIMKNVAFGSAVASGPFGIELTKNRYLLLDIPFNAGNTELMIPFYRPQWYENMDLLITSDFDYVRYKQEPERFRSVLEFYVTLRAHWSLVHEVLPQEGQDAPTFWLYRPPERATSELSFNSSLIRDLVETSDSTLVLNFAGKLGLILSMKEQFKKSEQMVRLVLQIDYTNIPARQKLGELLLHEQRYDDAVEAYAILVRFDSTNAEARAQLGDLLIRQGNIDVAEQELKKALFLNDHLENAYLSLNVVYVYRNDLKSAVENLEKYHLILPSESEKATAVTQMIEKLKAQL